MLEKQKEVFEDKSKVRAPSSDQKYSLEDFNMDFTNLVRKLAGMGPYEKPKEDNSGVNSAESNPYRTASPEEMKAWVEFVGKKDKNPSYEPSLEEKNPWVIYTSSI